MIFLIFLASFVTIEVILRRDSTSIPAARRRGPQPFPHPPAPADSKSTPESSILALSKQLNQHGKTSPAPAGESQANLLIDS